MYTHSLSLSYETFERNLILLFHECVVRVGIWMNYRWFSWGCSQSFETEDDSHSRWRRWRWYCREISLFLSLSKENETVTFKEKCHQSTQHLVANKERCTLPLCDRLRVWSCLSFFSISLGNDTRFLFSVTEGTDFFFLSGWKLFKCDSCLLTKERSSADRFWKGSLSVIR